MSGDVGIIYETWRTELLTSLAHVEAMIDFGDDELDVMQETSYQNIAIK